MRYRDWKELGSTDRKRFAEAGQMAGRTQQERWERYQDILTKDTHTPIDVDGTIILAGDILEFNDGSREYVFGLDGEKCGYWLGLNACSASWIERELRYYGEEVYPMGGFEGASIVGHYDGLGDEWYVEMRKASLSA